MRIIAGEHRGRTLLAPQSQTTRPITDRVKQSLFDILSPRIEGARVYDIFAGTGSMGLEALSRGARAVVFFERDRSALTRLHRNIQALSATDRARVVDGDLFRRISAVRPPDIATTGATLVFFDPPYAMLRERPVDLQSLAVELVEHHLAGDALVSFRHDARDALPLPRLRPLDVRVYGQMTIELLSIDTSAT